MQNGTAARGGSFADRAAGAAPPSGLPQAACLLSVAERRETAAWSTPRVLHLDPGLPTFIAFGRGFQTAERWSWSAK
jgi:hypothetical protein